MEVISFTGGINIKCQSLSIAPSWGFYYVGQAWVEELDGRAVSALGVR
jgi:hypothetical protein